MSRSANDCTMRSSNCIVGRQEVNRKLWVLSPSSELAVMIERFIFQDTESLTSGSYINVCSSLLIYLGADGTIPSLYTHITVLTRISAHAPFSGSCDYIRNIGDSVNTGANCFYFKKSKGTFPHIGACT